MNKIITKSPCCNTNVYHEYRMKDCDMPFKRWPEAVYVQSFCINCLKQVYNIEE